MNFKISLLVVACFLVLSAFTNTSSVEVGGAYLTYADKFGGEVTKEDLTTCQEVKIVGCAAGSKIVQLNLYITKGGKAISHKSDTGNLTKEMVKDLGSLQTGDSFEFKKIRAQLPGKRRVVDVATRKFVVV